MAKLYEYAIIHHAPERTDRDGNDITEKDALIQAPKWLLADDDRQVSVIAAREIPESYLGKLSEVEIIIRPFA